jgi:hypothetical protein
MVISPGLAATATAITRTQERFDAQAQAIVAATEDLAGADPAAGGAGATAVDAPAASDLAGSLVSLQADSFVNRVLFAVYRKQQDQMSEIADLVKPKD